MTIGTSTAPSPGLPLLTVPQAATQPLTAAAKLMEPALKAALHINIETASYMSRRMRAALDLPRHLASCRDHRHASRAAAGVLEEAAADAHATAHRLLDLWVGAFVHAPMAAFAPWAAHAPKAQLGARTPASVGPVPATMRDVLTFPDPKSVRRPVTAE